MLDGFHYTHGSLANHVFKAFISSFPKIFDKKKKKLYTLGGKCNKNNKK